MSGSAGEMKASLLLTLEDQLSGGVNKLTEVLDRLIGTTDKLGNGFSALTEKLGGMFSNAGEKIEQATQKVGLFERALGTLGETAKGVGAHLDGVLSRVGNAAEKIGALGAAGAGYSIVEPVRKFAEYEDILTHIAITKHLEGAAADAEIKRLSTLFAADAQRTGQSSESIAGAYYDFITSKLPGDVVDKIIGQHSMAATAYRIDPRTLGPAVLALIQNLHIPEADIGAAIGALAEAAKSGRFKVEDFARELPAVSGQMAALGMTGRGGADFGFAALEIVQRLAGSGGQSAADFFDALRYTTMHREELNWKKYAGGIDIDKKLVEGEAAGKNPIEVYLDLLTKLTEGKTKVEQGIILNTIMPNAQSATAFMALLQNRPELDALRGTLDKKDATAVAGDFTTAFASPAVTVRLFEENVAQATRSLGAEFTPALHDASGAVGALKGVFDWLETTFPTGTHVAGEGIGVFLVIVAALGAIGFAAPLVKAGADAVIAAFSLLGAPGVLVAGATALVAALTYLQIHNPAEALQAANAEHPERAGVLPGQTRLPGMPHGPDAGPNFSGGLGGAPHGFQIPTQKIDLHVTADPGLKVTGGSSSPDVTVTTPDTLNQSVGRP